MKRLNLIGSWRRLGIQAGVLGGLGLAFVGGGSTPAVAGRECFEEAQCTYKKPNFMIVLDYSSSMNDDFVPGQTRWEAAVEAIDNMITTDNGYFDSSMHLGLLHFGHDPDPDNPGSTITVNGFPDTSGLVDGVRLDVPWYDPENDPSGYFECNGQAIIDYLDEVDPPLCVPIGCSGIGTWTNGGMLEAQQIIAQTRTDHPEDLTPGDERFYAILLMTDGEWHDVDGTGMAGEPPEQNPAITAADLYDNDGVPTYVVAFGAALGLNFADEVAQAGGTTESIQASAAGSLEDALVQVLQDIQNQVIIPECTSGLPRIMVVLDASSSMLNIGVNPNFMPGPMGQTGWDQARDALAGASSMFQLPISGANNQPVEDLVHLGLIVYGHDEPVPEDRVLVNYGPCMQDNFNWALDPDTSCGAGCVDPWGGPPIIWTFEGPGTPGYPGFDADTYSHMPRCNVPQIGDFCSGSGTFTHLGIELANSNADAYRASPPALYPIDAGTVFINILITDGAYQGSSTNAQVENALVDLYQNDNTTTYVIGFGDAIAIAELGNMACWGSGGGGLPCAGGTIDHFEASSQADLEEALATIIESVNFDPCCAFNDCSFTPEPTTGEVDPVQPEPTSTSEDDGSTTASAESSSGGAVDGSSSGGDSTGTPPGTSSGGPSDSSGPGLDDSTGGSGPTLTTNASVSDSSTGETDTVGGNTDDSGCGCQTGNNRSSGDGWLAALMMFGVGGVLRRRRR